MENVNRKKACLDASTPPTRVNGEPGDDTAPTTSATQDIELTLKGRQIVQTTGQESPLARSYKFKQMAVYFHIAFFSICGCLCRIGLDQLFGNTIYIEDPGRIVNQSFFSNIFGSFILGALHGSSTERVRSHAFYKGLTTGFCGSLTTWSKWNQQLSLTLIGETPTSSQPQVLSVASWFIGFYSFIGSFCVGIDFGKDIGERIRKRFCQTRQKIIDIVVSTLLFFSIIGFAFGTAFDSTQLGKRTWLAVLFAPLGAFLRAWLAKFKVKRYKLPLGTLLANVFGALLLSITHVINSRVAKPACTESTDICWPIIVTYGIGTGFCACLTTISTFVSEFFHLRHEHPVFAYSYIILTVMLCQILCGIINGVNHAQSQLTYKPVGNLSCNDG